jgi:hypothetical protein
MSSAPVRMGAPKDSMEGRKLLPTGRYTVVCDGFAQKMSKNKENPSVNFNPKLRIINHPTLSGEKIFTSLNQGAGFILLDFSHMLGFQMQEEGDDVVFQGQFIPNPADPNDISKMTYQGPLQGATGDVELGVQKYNNKDQNFIKAYYCKVPGCNQKHSTELT